MSVHDVCETEVICESPSCTITRCKVCSSYHLHIGPMSLRLKEDMFKSISNTILNAQMVLLQDVAEEIHPRMSH